VKTVHYYATGITPAMFSAKPGTGPAYEIAARDSKGGYLDGGKNYKVTLLGPVSAANFWAFTVYDSQNPEMSKNSNEGSASQFWGLAQMQLPVLEDLPATKCLRTLAFVSENRPPSTLGLSGQPECRGHQNGHQMVRSSSDRVRLISPEKRAVLTQFAVVIGSIPTSASSTPLQHRENTLAAPRLHG
jgi:hypothetical protein